MISLREGEEILFEVRRHWFFIAIRALALVFLGLFPLLLFIVALLARSVISADLVLFGFIVYCFYLLVLWIGFYIFLTTYYLDVWYITNKRVLDVEQNALFSREVTTFHYDRIQDATVEVEGIIATYLKFGTLHIQTAGDDRNIELTVAAKPYDAKDVINKQLEKRNDAVDDLREVLGRVV
jgi:membrane protein YdbS with pleckstrin-like domain